MFSLFRKKEVVKPEPVSIYARLAKAQLSFNTPRKNCSVNYGQTNFRYADLTACIQAVRPALNDNGLFLTQDVDLNEPGFIKIYTRVYDEAGDMIENLIKYPYRLDANNKGIQTTAGAITYLKRYGVSALLGIVADDDLDDIDKNEQAPKPTPKPTAKKSPIIKINNKYLEDEVKPIVKKAIKEYGEQNVASYITSYYPNWRTNANESRNLLKSYFDGRLSAYVAEQESKLGMTIDDIPF